MIKSFFFFFSRSCISLFEHRIIIIFFEKLFYSSPSIARICIWEISWPFPESPSDGTVIEIFSCSEIKKEIRTVWECFVVFVHTVQVIKASKFVPQPHPPIPTPTPPTPPHPSLPPRPLHTIFSGCDDIPGEQDQTVVLGFNTALIFL